jgi:hypothetical protein
VHEEGLEVLGRHQCMGPVVSTITFSVSGSLTTFCRMVAMLDILPDGRRWPLYKEEYPELNLTNAGSTMMVDLPPVAHRRDSSYHDGAHRHGPPIRNESAKFPRTVSTT